MHAPRILRRLIEPIIQIEGGTDLGATVALGVSAGQKDSGKNNETNTLNTCIGAACASQPGLVADRHLLDRVVLALDVKLTRKLPGRRLAGYISQ